MNKYELLGGFLCLFLITGFTLYVALGLQNYMDKTIPIVNTEFILAERD